MNKTALLRGPFYLLGGLALFALAGNVPVTNAEPLTEAQRKCVAKTSKAVAKMLNAKNKSILKCLKAAGEGSETDPAECLTDVSGKVSRARSRLEKVVAKHCEQGARIIAAVDKIKEAFTEEPAALMSALFGQGLEATVAPGVTVANCQSNVVKRMQKLWLAKYRGFESCMKEALKEGADSPALLQEQCLIPIIPDTKGKIEKAERKLESAVDQCGGGDLDKLYPGVCAGSGEDFSTCLNTLVSAHGRRSVNSAYQTTTYGSTDTTNCELQEVSGVQECVCTLSATDSMVDLEDLAFQCLKVTDGGQTELDERMPMFIRAWGGEGGNGSKPNSICAGDAGKGGAEGKAQTETTYEDFKSGCGDTLLYYYLGKPGYKPSDGKAGSGGTATIVATQDLKVHGPTVSNGTCMDQNIVLIAPGGGGGGRSQCIDSDGGSGGMGGTAAAKGATSTGVAGQDGGKSRGGVGGNQGTGGFAGTTSGKTPPLDGNDGIGGRGGGVQQNNSRSGDQASTTGSPGWSNKKPVLGNDGQAGRGGNGGQADGGDGGAGGGGYGGGGGGGGGKSAVGGSGGGGGGAYALGLPTGETLIADPNATNPDPGNGSVQVGFGLACSITDDGKAIVDPILDDMVELFNAQCDSSNPACTNCDSSETVWECVACKQGLCPLDTVLKEQDVGCSDIWDVACSALFFGDGSIAVGKCDSVTLDLNVVDLDGLQDLSFKNFEVESINGTSGTEACQFSKNANDNENFKCSYSGTGTGMAKLTSGSELTLNGSDFSLNLRCKLDDVVPIDQKISGKFDCFAKNASATADYGLCAGKCEDDVDGAVTYLAIPTPDELNLDPGDQDCSFSEIKWDPPNLWEPLSEQIVEMVNAVEPHVGLALADALAKPVQEAINSVIPSLPYPNSCQ